MIHERSCIVVTGGAGFLGKYVVSELRKKGYSNVIVPRSAQYDLRKESMVEKLFVDAKPDVVLHLAAVVGGIGANQKSPGRFFYENAIMGIQMLEFARRHQVKKYLSVGTICSYPKFTPVPFKEEDLWAGYPEETNAPYGIAKKILIVQSEAYRDEYGFNSINVLPANLYGPGENFDLQTSHVLPALIRKCLEAKDHQEKSITLWGDGSVSREFLHAEDAARGIVIAMEKYHDSKPLNLGSGKEVSIGQLASIVMEVTGYKGVVRWDKSKPNGQPRRCIDTSRAEQLLGFKAQWDLAKGIEQMVGWYEAERKELHRSPSVNRTLASAS